ncbi:hypothetical protein B4168_0285 [Anoxybacillus flavithermus]|nr:hypothetical protein B4168_0285 [Anoxybacillus flavithermus]
MELKLYKGPATAIGQIARYNWVEQICGVIASKTDDCRFHHLE